MPANEAELAFLQRQVRDNPRSVAFVALAEQLRRAGRIPEALATLREGERHRPDHAPARVVLARVHLDLGNRKLAHDVLTDVVRVDPENLAAASLLGRLLAEEGRVDEAERLLERLRMHGGEEADIARALIERARRAAEIPRTADPFDHPAVAARLAALGAPDRALALWQRLDGAAPGNRVVREQMEALRAIRTATPPSPPADAPLPEWPSPARTPTIAALRRYADRVLRDA